MKKYVISIVAVLVLAVAYRASLYSAEQKTQDFFKKAMEHYIEQVEDEDGEIYVNEPLALYYFKEYLKKAAPNFHKLLQEGLENFKAGTFQDSFFKKLVQLLPQDQLTLPKFRNTLDTMATIYQYGQYVDQDIPQALYYLNVLLHVPGYSNQEIVILKEQIASLQQKWKAIGDVDDSTEEPQETTAETKKSTTTN